jgi:hypothetical protein
MSTSPPPNPANVAPSSAPLVTGLVPSSGALPGGTVVAVIGAGFSAATSVRFATSLSAFSIVSDNEIRAITPPGSGIVDVTVGSALGQSAVGPAARFTYIHPAQPSPASIQSVTPSSGFTCGGNSVTITGSGFLGLRSVLFGAIRSSYSAISTPRSLRSVRRSRRELSRFPWRRPPACSPGVSLIQSRQHHR